MFDNPMVKMASAIALVPLRVSADSLLVKEVTDMPVEPVSVNNPVFSFRQHFDNLVLPSRIGKQE